MAKKTGKTQAPVSTSVDQELAAKRGKLLLSWDVRPYLLEKRKAAILLVSTLLFSALTWYAFNYDWLVALLTIVISLASFSSFLFPSEYQLYENGVQVKTGINSPVFRRWTAFKDYRIFHDGVNMNYKPRQMRERLLKSQFLYFGDADPEVVKKIIKEHMDAVNA